MKKALRLLLPLLILLYVDICSAKNDRINFTQNITTSYTQPIIIVKGSRGSGGGFRCSKPAPKSNKPSNNKSNNWGSSNNSWGGSRNNTNKNTNKNKSVGTKSNKSSVSKPQKRKLSAADKKLAVKAKKSGTYYNDRKSARENFKKKNTTKYTSKYKTEPTTRPSHIPQSTSVGGINYNISYNVGYGGYGYMGPSGWMMYDMMSDMVMMDIMMNRTGYVIASDLGSPIIVRGSGYYLMWVLCILISVIIAIEVINSFLHIEDLH